MLVSRIQDISSSVELLAFHMIIVSMEEGQVIDFESVCCGENVNIIDADGCSYFVHSIIQVVGRSDLSRSAETYRGRHRLSIKCPYVASHDIR